MVKKKVKLKTIQRVMQLMREAGLKASQQQETLLTIMCNDGLQHSEIQETLNASQSSVSKNVKKLNKYGLTKVFTSGYNTSNVLTEEGKKLKKKIHKLTDLL